MFYLSIAQDPKKRLKSSMVKGNMGKLKVEKVYSILEEKFCLKACVLLRRESVVATPDPILNYKFSLARD